MYKEIQNGAVAKLYMRKCFLRYEEMCKYLTIYEEAVSHIWFCNCFILNFLIFEENLIFFFISVIFNWTWRRIEAQSLGRRAETRSCSFSFSSGSATTCCSGQFEQRRRNKHWTKLIEASNIESEKLGELIESSQYTESTVITVKNPMIWVIQIKKLIITRVGLSFWQSWYRWLRLGQIEKFKSPLFAKKISVWDISISIVTSTPWIVTLRCTNKK